MPQLRDVTVHVTDVHGNDLEEWGVQSLRGNKVSAYIKSTTDMPFRITVQPKMPYFKDERASGDISTARGSDDVHIKMEESDDDYFGQPSSSRRPFDRHESRHGARSGHKFHQSRRSSSSTGDPSRAAFENTWPPFTFLATLYLDGRKKPERKIVVYLDPSDEDFNPPSGLVKFKCRVIQGRDGVLRENAWVFKDIGIETVFDKIALRENAGDAVEPEDILVDAMNTSNLGDGHGGTGEENEKIGQIIVEIDRVKLGRKYKERNYRPKHIEGDREDVDMGGVGSDVVHTTGFEHLRNLDQRSIRCVEFAPFDRGEKPWATFQFFYRSHEQLQKFNFPGYPQEIQQKPLRQRELLNTTMANLTPLSIAHSQYKSFVFTKPEELSFETRVKKGSHDPTKIPQPEYKFNQCRDILKEASREPQEVSGKEGERSMSIQSASDATRRSSVVVAVKEKIRIRPTQPKFTPGRRKPNSSSVSNVSLSGSPPNHPTGSPIQPSPENSPIAGCHHDNAERQLSTHRGSDFDIFRTLSSASLALTEAATSKVEGHLKPKSAMSNLDIFRGAASSTSDDADADDEKDRDDEIELGSWESADTDEAESDKENQKSTADNDNDAARLHEQFRMVTIGSKRQRDEGMEGREDTDTSKGDKSVNSTGVAKKKTTKKATKKKTSPARTSSTPLQPPLDPKQGQAVEGKLDQQAIKRVKIFETSSTTEGGEEEIVARQGPDEKTAVAMGDAEGDRFGMGMEEV